MSVISIQDQGHWRELRSKHVGGSEVAALFNVQPFHTTHLELWLVKRGEASGDVLENERMFWGKLIEEPVAQGVAVKKGWKVEEKKVYLTCDDTPGMGCTPDRFIWSPERGNGTEPGLLQIKAVDRLEFLKWEDGQPPLKYQLQLQHELACAGYSWGALAALVGGNELQVFEFDAHADAIVKVKGAVRAFWDSVRDGIQPPATAEDYDLLREVYGDDTGPVIDLSSDNELPGLCAQALEAAERKKAAEKEEKAAKATILQKVGDAGKALCSGFEIKKTKVSKDGYFVKPSTYTMLKIKEDIAHDD